MPPPPADRSRASAGPARAVARAGAGAAEPVTDDAIGSKSLDDLNRELAAEARVLRARLNEVDSAGQQVLQGNADVLKKYPTWQVTIEGHCDERGTAEYNLALGERRAVAARTYLVSLGIPADRIRTVSYGKEFPFDPGTRRSGVVEEPPRALRHHGEVARLYGDHDYATTYNPARRSWRSLCWRRPRRLGAANREHEQMMADIRMLQEQNQRLQLALAALNEALKAVNAKLDDQAAATRKGFADQKLLIDGVTRRPARAAREARRDQRPADLAVAGRGWPARLVHQHAGAPGCGARARRTPTGRRPSGDRRGYRHDQLPAPAGAAARSARRPRRLYETAYADYTAGQWSLAVRGSRPI